MLYFRQVYDNKDLLALGNLKVELMQYHLEYAAKIGIDDKEFLHYSLEQALSTVATRDNYIFVLDNEVIGMSQVEEKVSAVDEKPILFVHGIYIRPGTQHESIGGFFLRYLCRKYKK